MKHARRLWPLSAALAGAALAVAGYLMLHPAGRQDGPLLRSLALVSDPKRRSAAKEPLERALSSGPPVLRAQAANLLASLLIQEQGRRAIADAAQLYSTAVQLDPTDDASKFDLELLLTLQRRQAVHAREQRDSAVPIRPTSQRAGPGSQSGGHARRYGY
jgi:hypothetical protein